MAGTLTLTLHPRSLEYIAARLGMLGELEALKQRSPVDYFRGCANDVRDLKRLEKLQHVLQRVRRLRVASVACKLRRGFFLEGLALQFACMQSGVLPGTNCTSSEADLHAGDINLEGNPCPSKTSGLQTDVAACTRPSIAFMLPCRDPTRLNLSPFRSLVHLELTGCDLSTSAWLGADVLRLQLRSLACSNSLEELWHLLAPSADRPSSQGACNHPIAFCPLLFLSSLHARRASWSRPSTHMT